MFADSCYSFSTAAVNVEELTITPEGREMVVLFDWIAPGSNVGIKGAPV